METITKILDEIHIPSHLTGYLYICEALRLALADISILNDMTRRLYPAVAARFDATPSRVERAMRHAVEAAWDARQDEIWEIYFGYLRQKPTNTIFLAMLADYMMTESRR